MADGCRNNKQMAAVTTSIEVGRIYTLHVAVSTTQGQIPSRRDRACRAASWKLLNTYILNTGPDPPGVPQNRPEMAGTGDPGPPKNSPTVEGRMQKTKCRPKVRHDYPIGPGPGCTTVQGVYARVYPNPGCTPAGASYLRLE